MVIHRFKDDYTVKDCYEHFNGVFPDFKYSDGVIPPFQSDAIGLCIEVIDDAEGITEPGTLCPIVEKGYNPDKLKLICTREEFEAYGKSRTQMPPNNAEPYLPKVGEVCEWHCDSNSGWRTARIIARDGNDTWMEVGGKKLIVLNAANFRPYQSPRDKFIEQCTKVLSKGVGECQPDRYLAEAVWDAIQSGELEFSSGQSNLTQINAISQALKSAKEVLMGEKYKKKDIITKMDLEVELLNYIEKLKENK